MVDTPARASRSAILAAAGWIDGHLDRRALSVWLRNSEQRQQVPLVLHRMSRAQLGEADWSAS